MNTIEALKAFLTTHKDGLEALGVTGYITDAISDAEFVEEKRIDEGLFDGSIPLSKPEYETTLNHAQQGTHR